MEEPMKEKIERLNQFLMENQIVLESSSYGINIIDNESERSYVTNEKEVGHINYDLMHVCH